MHSDESLVKKALRNGARGYLLKKSISEDLFEAIHNASRRQSYLSPELQKFNPDELLHADREDLPDNLFDRLTNREREVCQLIAYGFTNTGIAHQLGISSKTVEKHRANLMEKLGVQDVASLIREAIRHNVVIMD
jgi:two-component system response regulator NreC